MQSPQSTYAKIAKNIFLQLNYLKNPLCSLCLIVKKNSNEIAGLNESVFQLNKQLLQKNS